MWPKATGYGQGPPVMDGNLNEQLKSMLRMFYWDFKLIIPQQSSNPSRGARKKGM